MTPALRALAATACVLLVVVAVVRLSGSRAPAAGHAPVELPALGEPPWEIDLHAPGHAPRSLSGDAQRWSLHTPFEVPLDDTVTRGWDARYRDAVPVLEARPFRTTGVALGVRGSTAVQLRATSAAGSRTWSIGHSTVEGDTWIHDGGRFALRVPGNWRDAWDPPVEALRSRDVFGWTRDDVHAVRWHRDGVMVQLERRADGEWTCAQRPDGGVATPCDRLPGAGPLQPLQPVDTQEVHAWLGVLAGLRAVEIVPAPAWTGEPWLEIETLDRVERIGIIDGHDPPTIALAGVAGHFVVRASGMQRVTVGLDALRDRIALSLDPDAVASVYVQQSGLGWGVQCEPPTTALAVPECHTITGLAPVGGNPERRLVQSVTALRVVDWVSDVDPDWAMGANPDRVIVHLRQGGRHTLLLGATDPPLAATPESAIRFARVDDGPIFRLDPRTLSTLAPFAMRALAPD